METITLVEIKEGIKKGTEVTKESKKKFITTKEIEKKYLSLPSQKLEQQYEKFVKERNELRIELEDIKYYLEWRIGKYRPYGFLDELDCRIRIKSNLKKIPKISARIAELNKIIALMETVRLHPDEIEEAMKIYNDEKYMRAAIIVYGVNHSDYPNYSDCRKAQEEAFQVYKKAMQEPEKVRKMVEDDVAQRYKADAQGYYEEEKQLLAEDAEKKKSLVRKSAKRQAKTTKKESTKSANGGLTSN